MLNVIAKAAQTVAVNQNVIFTNTRVKVAVALALVDGSIMMTVADFLK